MASLFEAAGLDKAAPRPLADRLRPERLEDVVGQDHLLGPNGALTRMLATGTLGSLDLLGPARDRQDDRRPAACPRHRPSLRADLGGLLRRRRPEEGVRGGARRAARPARARSSSSTRSTASTGRSSNSFLPVMENGTVTLVGATTENPSFELNAALLSRARVLVFKPLDEAALAKLLARAEEIEGKPLPLDEDARAMLISMADSDGRAALTLAEEVWRAARAGRGVRPGRAAGDRPAPRADLRQEPGRPLQPHLGAAQDRARLRSRRGALLPRPHARRRRAAALHRPPPGAHGDGGHRPRRSAGARRRARRQGRLRLSRLAGRRTGARRGDRLSRHRAEIERGLHRLRRGDAGGEGGRLAGAAEDRSSTRRPS